MLIQLIAVGKLKERWMRDGFAEYEKRLARYCKFTLTELPESRLPDAPNESEITQALEQEGKAILQAAKGKLIALCIEGTPRSSEQLAAVLEQAGVTGDSAVTFVIGSSFGLADTVKRQADMKLSMSPMTFPHQLARILLMEQIYRAFQINSGGKYHK